MNKVESYIHDYIRDEIIWWYTYEDGDIYKEGLRNTLSDETIEDELITEVNKKFNTNIKNHREIDDMTLPVFCRYVRKHIE